MQRIHYFYDWAVCLQYFTYTKVIWSSVFEVGLMNKDDGTLKKCMFCLNQNDRIEETDEVSASNVMQVSPHHSYIPRIDPKDKHRLLYCNTFTTNSVFGVSTQRSLSLSHSCLSCSLHQKQKSSAHFCTSYIFPNTVTNFNALVFHWTCTYKLYIRLLTPL